MPLQKASCMPCIALHCSTSIEDASHADFPEAACQLQQPCLGSGSSSTTMWPWRTY